MISKIHDLKNQRWLARQPLCAGSVRTIKPAAPLILCLALSGCNAITVQYVDATGKRGTGAANISAMQTDGTFSVTDKGATCSGKFPSWRQMTVVFQVRCTDGQSGSVTMTRPASGPIAGEGTLQLTSGELRRFVFGKQY